MKILVVCQHYYPENFQITDICEALVKRGHQVTILTGLPNYPKGEIYDGYRKGENRHEIHNGVEIIRAKLIPRHSGVMHLGINYLSFCFFASLKTLFLKRDFDVIYSYQMSPILMVVPSILMKHLARAKMFLYCCDLWPESCELFLNKTSFLYKIIKYFSTKIYRQSDVIAVESEDFLDYFVKRHGIDEKRLIYIPQFADSAYLNENFYKPHEGINFVFLGNVGIAQNLGCFVEAFSKIHSDVDWHVHIVGTGRYMNELKKMVKSKGLNSRFTFHGRHTVEEMPRFYSIADACFLGLTGESIISNTIPSKLQGYMAAGKPVIASLNGSAQKIINQFHCGIAVPASDADALADAMSDFLNHPEKYKNCGENGREYFKEYFHKDKHLDAVESILAKLAKE